MPIPNATTYGTQSAFIGMEELDFPQGPYGFASGPRRIAPHIVGKWQRMGVSGTLTIVRPPWWRKNTLLVGFGCTRGAGSEMNVPTGWKSIVTPTQSSDVSPGLNLMYKVLEDTEDNTVSWAFTQTGSDINKGMLVVAIEGADPYDPFFSVVTSYNTGGLTTIPQAPLPAQDCIAILFAGCSTNNNTLTPIITFPSSFPKGSFETEVGSTRQSLGFGIYIPSATATNDGDDALGLTPAGSISATTENPEALAVVVIQGVYAPA